MGARNMFLYQARILQHRRFGRKSIAGLLSAFLVKTNLLVSTCFCCAAFLTLQSLSSRMGSYPGEASSFGRHALAQNWPAEARFKIESEGFSVMINGFHRERIPILKEVIKVYCQVPSVAKVYVTWGSEITAPVAEDFPCRVPVEVVTHPSSDLTNRFLPPDSLRTDAVLICDDDIFLSPSDVQFVFESFKENNDRIVGVFGRDFAEEKSASARDFATEKGKSLTYANNLQTYSIMLTKFLFVHRKYLDVFTQVVPPKSLQYINEISNCEDIALNFVVSKLSGLPPVNVNVSAIDYGDSRAYAKNDANLEAVRVSALSFRSSHKGQRSECLTKFQADFGKNYLQHTSAHVSKYNGERVLCRNGHDWVACGRAGKNNALRKSTSAFAFVTVLADNSPEHLMAANCWAKRLRDLKTPYDIVLVLVLGDEDKYDPEAFSDFTRVRTFKSLHNERALSKRQFNKFRIWQLTEYEKIVYLDLDVLVVENIDELFERPDLSAAPDILTGDKFNSGVLVIKPSMAFASTFQRNVDIFSYNKGDQGVLAALHSGWFSQDINHRLPTRYNFLKMLPDHYNPPYWFDKDTVETYLGPPKIVHFANPWFKPWLIVEAGESEEKYGAFWKKSCSATSETLPTFPEDPAILLWEDSQSVVEEKKKSKHIRISAPTVGYSLNSSVSIFPVPTKETYATVYGSSLPDLLVWTQSLRATGTTKKLIVIAPKNIPADEQKILKSLFDGVYTVDLRGEAGPERELSLVVELFNLNSYNKIVYFHPATLFVRSVENLFEHPSVSAVPAAYPSDLMSGKMLVLDPQKDIYRDLKAHVTAAGNDIPFFTLNNFFFDWFGSPAPHRISPGYHADMLFKPNLVKHVGNIRSFWIDNRWSPLGNLSVFSEYEHTKIASDVWIKSLCSAVSPLSRKPVPIDFVSLASGLSTSDLNSTCSGIA